ncbi:PP2C family protein-serine/threonine phosphatase [Actinacidiphila paucisporea]|nr:PP2C family protein-serine/threonine phosphatase [Actinacidiphila paucisporea]
MGRRRLPVDRVLEERTGRGLLAIALALIVAISVTDVWLGTSVHLGPLLVIAPTLTASFAGPRLTALVGGLAELALLIISVFHGGLSTTNHMAQLVALAVLSALVVFISSVRVRRERELSRVRSVAETAQRVLLRPPPRRVGPLAVAWRYLAAEDETQIGGDLFAVVRAGRRRTRVIIGDVRGHGLASIGEASMVMGAFREGAPRYEALPELVGAVEDSVCRDLEEVADTVRDPGEHFVTALLLDIPDGDEQAQMINRGHPPPLLVHGGEVTALHPRTPAPPLGLCGLSSERGSRIDPFTFEAGDLLLLYTDGVIEARSPTGGMYPLADRVASFPAAGPEALLRRVHRDLLEHAGERLSDDAALLVIERTASRHPRRPQFAVHPDDGRHRLGIGGSAADR